MRGRRNDQKTTKTGYSQYQWYTQYTFFILRTPLDVRNILFILFIEHITRLYLRGEIMPQSCSICIHPQLEAINEEIVSGTSLRNIAKQYPISVAALHRHKTAGHIPQSLTKAREAVVLSNADTLLHEVKTLLEQALSLPGAAQAAGDLSTARQRLGKAKEILELLPRLAGEIDNSTKVQVNIGSPSITSCPEWGTVIRIIDRHPEVKAELVEALQGVRLLKEVKS
jgi:hypothetical protein